MSSNPTTRVLITGGTGLLGVALQKTAPNDIEGYSMYFPERSLPEPLPFKICAADVTDRKEMRAIFDWAKPNVVIHTAAIGSVDFAEKNREQTKKVNVGGTKVVNDLCLEFQARIVYISSNAVFDGRAPFYAETDAVNPINYYGQLKVEAENIIKGSSMQWAIVRPILMYGWPYPGERDNPVVWWIRSLKDGKPIKVVDNVFNKPLPAWSCAESIWAIIQKNKPGIYHIAGRDHISLYRFALQVAEVFSLDASLISPVPDSYFPEIAPRPSDTSFDTTKMINELGIMPVSVKDGLSYMKSEKASASYMFCSMVVDG